MILTLLFVFFVIFLYWYNFKISRLYRKIEKIPGPPILPLIGNVLEFGTDIADILINLNRIARKYGPVVRLCFGTHTTILLTEPKYIGQILASTEDAYKSDIYDILKCVLGNGLLTNSGETWNRHRRIIGPTFNTNHLEKYVSVFNKNSNKLVAQLKEMVDLESIDVTNHIMKCTLNTICNTAMEIDITDNPEFYAAYTELTHLLVQRFFSPIKRFDSLYRLTRDYRTGKKYEKTIREFTDNVISTRKRIMKDNRKAETQSILIDQLLSASEEDALTDEEVRDEVQTFLIGGSDTVGSTVSLGLFELAKHPDVQEKLLSESDYILGTNKTADISFNDVHNLKYTERVYKEILRFYPPAPFLTRKLKKDITFDNYQIPSGTHILISISGTHLSESNFKDAERFDPDRFLPEYSNNIRGGSFIPFGSGPRICIGQKYAMLQAKVILAKLIRNFKILPVQPEHKLVLTLHGSLKSLTGLPIQLKLR